MTQNHLEFNGIHRNPRDGRPFRTPFSGPLIGRSTVGIEVCLFRWLDCGNDAETNLEHLTMLVIIRLGETGGSIPTVERPIRAPGKGDSSRTPVSRIPMDSIEVHWIPLNSMEFN